MAQIYGPNIVTDGLVLAWNAADRNSYPGSGTVVYDITGNGSDSTLVNGTTFNSANGGYFVLDGTNDYISNSSNSIVKGTISGMNSWSISMWLYVIGDQSYMPYFNKGGYYEGITIHGGRFEGGNGTNYFDVTLGGVSYNVWSLYTVTYDASALRVYINSNNINSYNWSYGFGTGNNYSINWGIFWANTLHGNIAGSSLYNRALSAQEILQNYNAQKSRFNL
jgi:hypothetical protein